MGSARVREISNLVKGHDSCLFAQETHPGRIDIMRKNRDGMAPPHFIMALTDTWQPTGTPVPWGSEPILNRLRAMDLWRDDTFVERYIADCEKLEKSRERGMRNSIESFLYDFRSQFQKATDSINTSTLNKVYRKEGSHAFSQSR